MGVHAHEQRAVDAFLAAVIADRLGGGEDVPLVEAALERGTAMPGGAERHLLRRVGRVRPVAVVARHQARQMVRVCGSGRRPALGAMLMGRSFVKKAMRRPIRARRRANETPVGVVYPELRPQRRWRFPDRQVPRCCVPAKRARRPAGTCSGPAFLLLNGRQFAGPLPGDFSHERRRTHPPARL